MGTARVAATAKLKQTPSVIGAEYRKQRTEYHTRYDTVAEMRSVFEISKRVGETAGEAADCRKLVPRGPAKAGLCPENLPDDALVLHMLREPLSS